MEPMKLLSIQSLKGGWGGEGFCFSKGWSWRTRAQDGFVWGQFVDIAVKNDFLLVGLMGRDLILVVSSCFYSGCVFRLV